MRHRHIALLLGFLFCALTALQAQKPCYVIKRDSVTKRDTIVFGGTMLKESPVNRQYAITVLTAGSTQTFTPHDIVGYYHGREMYLSKALLVEGRVQQLFVAESGAVGGAFLFYKYLNPQGEAEYYYQSASPSDERGEAPPLLPVKGEGDAVFAAELTDCLEQYPITELPGMQALIRRSAPTYKRYRWLYDICSTGNTNMLPPAFRWGVVAEGGLGSLSNRPFQVKNPHLQGSFGLFADVHVVEGLSVRPELTYHKYSFVGLDIEDGKIIEMAYNRQDLTTTLLLRYTTLYLKGKWLPFIQAGIDGNIALSRRAGTLRYVDEYYGEGYQYTELPVSWGSASFVVGAGVEYRLLPRHSLFIDVRYRKEFATARSLSGFYINLSYNL